jgi:hypothetical protein
MTKLKLTSLPDDKPVKLNVELPASLYRDLVTYGELLAKANGAAGPIEPVKLIVPMLERFITTDRAFVKARRLSSSTSL